MNLADDPKVAGVRPVEALLGLGFLLLGLWSVVDGSTWLGVGLLVLGGLWLAAASSDAARRALLGPVARLRR